MMPLFLALLTAAQPIVGDTSVVARVGGIAITADELLTSYEFGPAFVKRSPDRLRRHLEYMINERLLALEALRLGFDTTSFVSERREALAEDLAVEQLYRDVILSRVHLSDDQIALDAVRAGTTVVMRWIYCPTETEALRVQNDLLRGAPFDSLFARNLDSLISEGSRSLETTVLRLERDNPIVAAALERLHEGESSGPIRGPDGVYIFHLDRMMRNPLITQTEAAKLRHDAVAFRSRMIADSLAEGYVRAKMMESNPVIKAEGFNIVRALIGDRGLSHDTRVQWNIPTTYWTEAGPQPISTSGTMMDRPLVTFGARTFTVRDYARWYDIRQFQLDTRSPEAFNSSVKRTVWKMVQDRLLSEEASSRGMFERTDIVLRSREWRTKLLYLAGRSHVMRSIQITDNDLRQRYSRERKRLRDGSGQIPAFEAVRQRLWEVEYAMRESRTLNDAIAGLRKRTGVWVDETKVKELQDSIPADSRPLEAVFYKPGGTFPRVAFPTIDEAWERLK